MQINQISGWFLIVPNQIAHQNVENVIVDGNGFAKSGHDASRSEAATVSAISLNGQHFVMKHRLACGREHGVDIRFGTS